MFIHAAGPPLAYRDPWSVALDERIAALVRRERRVAYLYERPDSHTFRYRVFNMIEALDAQPHFGISAGWFTREDLDGGLDFLDRADLLVICRVRYDHRVGQLIARAQARGVQILYDIDDLIFDLRYAHRIGDTINRQLYTSDEWDWYCAYIGRLGMTLQHCNGAIATNAYLAKLLEDFLPGRPVRVIPNFYNRWQADVSAAIYRRKFDVPMQRDGRLHVGYFSGTHTHTKDFAIVVGALDRLLEEDRSASIHIVGSLEIPPRLARYGDRVQCLPLQDFVNLQRLQGQVELAIAPTQDDIFTNCKSELKFFEAALVGTAVIASPTHAFRAAISDGDNGFLAVPHLWYEKLATARDLLAGDGGAYRALAARARAYVELRYAPQCQAGQIAVALFGDDIPTTAAAPLHGSA